MWHTIYMAIKNDASSKQRAPSVHIPWSELVPGPLKGSETNLLFLYLNGIPHKY
ncbi:hypothetical protein B5T_04406 [Alloalcanivorax dieselolei B5]|uniref:Uncharacterized protein n=1 Tax=Alcanivorax dieselolei (strain DSM 16502 / CGMCC 1.3690 / MCCC 1A00001 / B-5) TaxID=930169 RepID=K0CJV2_ALCDB|nr:hypothetical protein B5T_04406 [Alloalcanivorax dieselolei B5]